jgi:hypothetical protein
MFNNEIEVIDPLSKITLDHHFNLCDTIQLKRAPIMKSPPLTVSLNRITLKDIAMNVSILCPAVRPIQRSDAGCPDPNMTRKRCTSSGIIESILRKSGKRSRSASTDSFRVVGVQRGILKGSSASFTVLLNIKIVRIYESSDA